MKHLEKIKLERMYSTLFYIITSNLQHKCYIYIFPFQHIQLQQLKKIEGRNLS